ncbi:unnamed protein product [Bursaphelenchus okinawaensis]|uniref:Uncharacterized protein n=1 Tax=Bursaphelenchus okinawaensis TaxID=465554 RepID=A0A811KRA1_9BILA|nr:unnamed protein product [Bursaphelenchus okinawaensis]CAG9109906.1 unnamed protein product [Bursaphelenchus okinawaensis]
MTVPPNFYVSKDNCPSPATSLSDVSDIYPRLSRKRTWSTTTEDEVFLPKMAAIFPRVIIPRTHSTTDLEELHRAHWNYWNEV